MAPDIKEYDPFEALAAPAPPLDVSPVEFSKDPITGFREPERLMNSAVVVQTRSFFKRRNAHVRHSYTALPPEHIRILIIRPGRTGQKLELDLMQIPFEEPYTNLQPYEALSYDWDSGPAVFPVILRDYTRRSLNERYPINGDERASTTHWKRVCFAIFRDFKKVRWDDKMLETKTSAYWKKTTDSELQHSFKKICGVLWSVYGMGRRPQESGRMTSASISPIKRKRCNRSR